MAGAQRANLEFAVTPTSGGEKFAHLHQWLLNELPMIVVPFLRGRPAGRRKPQRRAATGTGGR